MLKIKNKKNKIIKLELNKKNLFIFYFQEKNVEDLIL